MPRGILEAKAEVRLGQRRRPSPGLVSLAMWVFVSLESEHFGAQPCECPVPGQHAAACVEEGGATVLGEGQEHGHGQLQSSFQNRNHPAGKQ